MFVSGAVAFFSIIIFFVCLVLGGLDYSNELLLDDNIFEATRTTQLTTLQDCINIGDYIVNNECTLDEETTKEIWRENFEFNNDLNAPYTINFIEVNSFPAAIAAEISFENELKSIDEISTTKYFSLILVDDKRSN